MMGILTVPVFQVQATENDVLVTEQPSPTPSAVPIRELVTKGNKIYYYYKGKMVKTHGNDIMVTNIISEPMGMPFVVVSESIM